MKKLLLFVFAFMALIACDDDNDNGGGTTTPYTKGQIVGAWVGDEIEYREVVPGLLDTTQTDDISYININFNSNNTGTIDSAGIDAENITWDLIGDNQLILDGDTFMIETLSGSNFNFGYSEVEDLGNDLELISTQTIKLTK